VQKLAAETVSQWRNAMQKKKAQGSGSSTPKPAGAAAANGTASPAASGASPVPTGATKAKRKYEGNLEKRNSVADKMDTALLGNKIRDSCLKLMYDGLAYMSTELPEEIIVVAREVELAAYNKFQPETSEPYRTKLRSLYQNLKNKSNPQLRARVLSGEIPPSRFVVMTHDELKSAERKAEDEKLMKENMDKAMVAQEERSISSQLRCGKCGQKKVSYTQAQTRSADEPMTTFCTCMNCGNRWKFS